MQATIVNQTGTSVWCGLYAVSDRGCRTPLGGEGRKQIDAGATLQIDIPDQRKVQAVFWKKETDDPGTQNSVSGACLAGPKTVSAHAPVTLVEDDGHLYICNRLVDHGHPVKPIEKIEHVVVVMMENRSLDNLAGWLYAYKQNKPPHNVGNKIFEIDPFNPTYDGLLPASDDATRDKRFWNTFEAASHDATMGVERVYAGKPGDGTRNDDLDWPNPGPFEVVPGFVQGIFGTPTPGPHAQPNMTGFLADYLQRIGEVYNNRQLTIDWDSGTVTCSGRTTNIKERPDENLQLIKNRGEEGVQIILKRLARRIMACYTPEQLPVFSALARQFAISDRWFCSIPCQTWPNRAVFHAGTSFGRLNNLTGLHDEGESILPWNNMPSNSPYVGPTVFEALYEEGVRAESYQCGGPAGITLLGWQFYGLTSTLPSRPHAYSRDRLAADLNAIDQHPNYVFIEPQMYYGSGYVQQDYHPPAKVAGGEAMLKWVYETLTACNVWHKTLLVITFDESGNCFDHVPPPAAARLPKSDPPQFNATQIGDVDPFSMYGPRIPTILVSPLIESGTVFRSDKNPVDGGGVTPEYDHCSMLASLRDWVFGEGSAPDVEQSPVSHEVFAQNTRIVRAPTIWQVLTRNACRQLPARMDDLVNAPLP